jgi:formiminotetrahydrofolate cyclodeaminase
MLANLKVSEFIDRLSAGTPTPGGGSAAALAGTVAAALGGMVCELTLGKEKYEGVRPEMEKARSALAGLRKDLLALVDRDAEAYDEVSKALKLPKQTPEEKESRRVALSKASQFATEIPVKTAESCLAVLQHVKVVAEKGNPNAASDAGVAAHLAHCGVAGAILNVRTNLSGIPDKELAGRIESRVAKMEQEAARTLSEAQAAVSARLSG